MKFSGITWLSLLAATSTSCQAFQVGRISPPGHSRAVLSSSSSLLHYSYHKDHHEADMMEWMVGGERYEMVPLPDSMMETTLYVGNLCEFCQDGDLSLLFQTVSELQSVPACVVRKANMSSLRYGFVTFLTVQEKEAAIMKFHKTTFKGRSIKVEAIRDHPKMGRVKVPERMVSYVVGHSKRTRSSGNHNGNSSLSSLRSIARLEKTKTKEQQHRPRQPTAKQLEKRRQLKEKKELESQTEFPLSTAQQDELLRAARRGYLTLDGRDLSRNRGSNSLACAHRQYCDERERPQIVLCRAAGVGSKRSPLDCLIVDLSPLRLSSAVGADLVNDFVTKWKAQTLAAAANAEMELRPEYREDNCENLVVSDDCPSDDMDQGISDHMALTELLQQESSSYMITLTDEDSWATEPISRLPVLSMGVFEGERSRAKAMAKELAELWDLPMEPLDLSMDVELSSAAAAAWDERGGDGKKPRGNKARRHRKNENRKRRRDDQRYLDSMQFRHG